MTTYPEIVHALSSLKREHESTEIENVTVTLPPEELSELVDDLSLNAEDSVPTGDVNVGTDTAMQILKGDEDTTPVIETSGFTQEIVTEA